VIVALRNEMSGTTFSEGIEVPTADGVAGDDPDGCAAPVD
jgi:hypothetical protein